MIKLNSPYDCCGCTACESVCGHHAITMLEDKMGFLYPTTDVQKCIDCGLCNKACPIIRYDSIEDKTANPKVYALHNKNLKVWQTSSSGGVFATMVDYAIGRNGIVFGAAYDECFAVRHRKAETQAEALAFRGSKYVQSDMRGIYLEVRRNLRAGRFVLFSGTPCQVEGLKGFLMKPYDNLLTVDIMCHGVPSPKVFADYVKFIQTNSPFRLTCIYMKDKEFGWSYQNLRLYFGKHKSQFNTIVSNLWNKIFYSHLATRPSCHKCRFTNYLHSGDITIGDFWGIENSHPEFYDDKGISLLFANNKKGEQVWHAIKEKFEYIESDTKRCVQPNLQHPAKEPEEKATFWKEYESIGFKKNIKRYYNIRNIDLIFFYVKELIRQIK